MGFTDFLFKPVEPSRLVERVQTLLRPPASAPSVGEGQLVVAVDDDPVQLKLLKIHLETLGFRVITAHDGAGAVMQARRSSPQALVADVLMSPMDGFTLCQAIRRDPALPNLPVVLMSAAYIDEADHALARAAGANAYVAHDPDFRALDEALVKALRSTGPTPTAQPSALPIEDLDAQIGYAPEHRARLADGFGVADFFLDATPTHEPVLLPSSQIPDHRTHDILATRGVESMLIVPLVAGPTRLGLLVAVSAETEIDSDIVQFVRICANYAAQAIRTARAIDERHHLETQLRQAQKMEAIG